MDETVVKKNVTTHQTHRPSTCDKTVTVVKKRSDSQQTPCPPNSDHSSSEWNEILSTSMNYKNKTAPRLLLPKSLTEIDGTPIEQAPYIQNLESNLCSVLKNFEEKLDN